MSITRFGVNKPVPVNLLMVAILLAGLVLGLSLRRAFFPEIEPLLAMVTLPYPGATPEEVEGTLAIKVEDKLADLDEIKELRTTVSEGGGSILVEFHEGVEVDKAVDEVERAIDALTDLPQESEKIEVRQFEPRLPVIRVTLCGDLDEPVMKRAIRDVRDDLLSLPGMGEILVEGVRDYEIRIEVGSDALVQHGISLPEIADVIRSWMMDVPGATVRSTARNIKVRTVGVAEQAATIRQIVVRSDSEGRALHVGDIAQVTESFVEDRMINRFNGQPAANLIVFKVGEQDIIGIAGMVRGYVAGRSGEPFDAHGIERLGGVGRLGFLEPVLGADQVRSFERLFISDRYRAWELGRTSRRPLPPASRLVANADFARFVEGRLSLLIRNASYGAALVFTTLLLFLNWRVAMWVGVGLLVAIMGTLVLMSWINITLNLLTMFGLIVVMGLLVDDAIVVSENIQARYDRGEDPLEAAVSGTEQVLWPVVATVLTSVVAFLPLTFIRGHIGDLLGALPTVVACALLMSLIESLLILPSHMGHSLARRSRSLPGRWVGRIRRAERARDRVLFDRIVPCYARLLAVLMRHRYVSVAVALSVLIVSLGMVHGGRLSFTFLQDSDAENVIVDIGMPIGTPLDRTNQVVADIERAIQDQPEIKSVSTVVGQRADIESGVVDAFSPHIAQMFVELEFVERRERESSLVVASIQETLKANRSELERITFTEMTGGPVGPDISVQVRGEDAGQVEAAVADLKRALAGFAGVYGIADDIDAGQLEVRIQLKPGPTLGLTTADVARQVRGFLYGVDAHVFAAKREDIDVRVRLDEATRKNLFAIENSWLISPTGQAVPLTEIADIVDATTYATIRRVDRKRSVLVTADTAPALSPESISGQIDVGALRAQYPRVEIDFTGRQRQLMDALGSLPLGFMAAVVGIYVILAWLFSSFVQPIIVLLVVPFAVVGVVWGHLALGYELTFLSLIGFVALSGIVVNDALILVKFFNEQRAAGVGVFDGLVAAGRARFRAIMLTTITTVLGLTPLILEQSFQAKFLIPMAISIAAGLISATVVVLVILPCTVLIFEDLRAGVHLLWYGTTRGGDR